MSTYRGPHETIWLTVTRGDEDIYVECIVSEGVVSRYARDEDHGAVELTEDEREVVRNMWEKLE